MQSPSEDWTTYRLSTEGVLRSLAGGTVGGLIVAGLVLAVLRTIDAESLQRGWCWAVAGGCGLAFALYGLSVWWSQYIVLTDDAIIRHDRGRIRRMAWSDVIGFGCEYWRLTGWRFVAYSVSDEFHFGMEYPDWEGLQEEVKQRAFRADATSSFDRPFRLRRLLRFRQRLATLIVGGVCLVLSAALWSLALVGR